MSASDPKDTASIPGFCTLCRSRCGTLNRVENGRLVEVTPQPSHPTGRAICTKGRAAPQIAHNARRLQKPLRRTRPKSDPDPGWAEITWDEALNEIASRLLEVRRQHGAEAVVFAVSSPSGTATCDSFDWIERFNRVFGSPNQCNATEICNWQKDHAHVFTFGCGTPPGDYRNAELIILWGFNPATSWLAIAGEVEEGRKRGAKLMVVDPRLVGQGVGADYWLRVRPGTDAALALGLANQLIETNSFDHKFVRKWTNAPFLVRDDTGKFLRAIDLDPAGGRDLFLIWNASQHKPAPYDPANEASDIAAAEFALRGQYEIRIGDTVISCRPAFERYVEIARQFTPERVARICGIAPDDLRAAAGALSRAKAISYHAWTGIAQQDTATQSERAIAVLYALTGCFDKPGSNVQLNRQPVRRINSYALLPPGQAEKALGLGTLPLGPPAQGWIPVDHIYTAILDKKPYAVHALMAFGSNILVSLADTKRGRTALEALPFQVHCDLFETPTARYADIVLPVNSAWEREGMRIGFEISAAAEELIQLRPQMVPSLGESRSDLSIIFDLAVRMGMGEAFFGGDIDAGYNHVLEPVGLTVAQLREHPEGIRRPVSQSHRKYADRNETGVKGFATPTKRVEIYSELLLANGYPPLPEYPQLGEDDPSPFPFILTTARNGQFCHSQHRSLVTLRRRAQEPGLEMNRAAAKVRGIHDDDWVVVTTRHGTARFRARLSETVQPDTIVAEYGWWEACKDMALPGYALGGPISSSYNDLIGADAIDPISGAVAMRTTRCAVELERAATRTCSTPMVVRKRETEAENVVSLTLRPADAEMVPAFDPGQYVMVRAKVPALGLVDRSYSLSGKGQPQRDYKITVKRLLNGQNAGAMSGYLHDFVRVGDQLDVGPPQGKFRIPVENDFPVVLIAAGIGITPFVSFLESLSADTMPEVVLYYGNRNRRSHAFAERIQNVARQLPALTVHDFYSRPDSTDLAGTRCIRTGRITHADIDEALIARRARFYLCGPDAMLQEMKVGLAARGVPPFEIFLERFFSSAEPGLIDHKGPHQVHFARSGRVATWSGQDKDLMRFGEAHGVRLPSGCRTGQCESCAVRVLEGKVHHRVSVEMEEPDLCLTCQAVPISNVVLDV